MNEVDRDEGSVVVMALVILLLGSLAVSTLTAFHVAVIRSRVPLDRRTALENRADSALSLALTTSRRRGYDSTRTCPPPPPQLVDVTVTIECQPQDATGRHLVSGLVTTLNSSTLESQTLPSWSGSTANAIQGAIAINTGTLGSPATSFLADRRLPNSTGSTTWRSATTSWSAVASSHDIDTPRTYPPLPPLPTFERPGSQALIGSCNVYFPGRYLGSSALVLTGGLHYFASGVYYFERSLTITSGARVVMGQGDVAGCADDSAAASTSRSPRRHEISGRGATLLLGGAARVVVQESSLAINSRLDEVDISLRTVGFGTSTSTAVIPADSVRLANGSLVPAATHTVVPPESTTSFAYVASTLAPSTALALDVRLNGTNPETNRILIAGQIFTPHAGVRITSTTASYAVALAGGLVTTRLTTSLSLAPSGTGSGYLIGSTLVPDAGATMNIESVASDGRFSATAAASLHIKDGQWSLFGRSSRYRRDGPG